MRILRVLLAVPIVGVVILGGASAADGYPSRTTRVTVHSGVTTRNINASISKGAAIAGKITATNHAALGSAYVQVFASNGAFAGGAMTNRDGTYKVVSLRPSRTGFYVCASADNAAGGPSTQGYVHRCYGSGAVWRGSTPPSSAKKVPTVTGVVKRDINIALPSAGGIAGRITATNGSTAISRVAVDVVTTSGKIVASTFTFRSAYSIESVPPGTYKVCFDAGRARGGPSHTGYLSQCWRHRPWRGNGPPPSSAVSVHVVAAHRTGKVNAVLSPGGAISGTVRTAGVSHKPLAHSFVAALTSRREVARAETNSAGVYKLVGLPAGSYKVCTFGGTVAGSTNTYPKGQCWKGVAWSRTAPSRYATAVKASVGQTHRGINMLLRAVAHPVGTIAGTVKSSSGKPLRNVVVTVYSGKSPSKYAMTGANGTYKVTRLTPSSTGYAVCFSGAYAAPRSGSAPATGYASVCFRQRRWDGGALPAHPVKVGVKGGKTHSGINAVLGTGGAISGTVKYGSKPLNDVGVTVLNSHKVTVAFGHTGSNGRYTVKGLTPGTGYITCFLADTSLDPASPTGYRSQCYKQRVWND